MTLLVLPILLILVLAAVAGIVLLFLHASKRGKAEPACGKCGYAVRGLSSFTCPECGADLREVGIVTAKGGIPTAAWIILWGTLLLIIACPLSGLWVALVGPMHHWNNDTVTLSAPQSNQYTSITLRSHATTTAWFEGLHRKGRTIPIKSVELHIKAPKADMSIELPTQPPPDKNDILRFMQTATVDVSHPRIPAEVDHILAIVHAAPGGGLAQRTSSGPSQPFLGTGTSGGSGSEPSVWAVITPITFWLIVFAYGVRFVLRKRRGSGPSASMQVDESQNRHS